MKTSDFLKNLLTKAGVTHDGEIGEDIPDEIATSVDNALLTIKAATNGHPDVRKVYLAEAFNGLDAQLKILINEFGLPEDIRNDIESQPSTTKKTVALIRKIKELSAKEEPADKTKAVALQTQINDLVAKLQAEVAAKEGLKTNYDKQLQEIKIKTKLGSMLTPLKTVYDELDPAAKEAAINALLAKSLQDSDADFTFDEKGNLSLIKKDGTNLFGDNHTLITPQSFIDKSLSKIYKVTNGATANGKTTPAATVPGGEQNQKNKALDAALDESLQAYKASTASPVTV